MLFRSGVGTRRRRTGRRRGGSVVDVAVTPMVPGDDGVVNRVRRVAVDTNMVTEAGFPSWDGGAMRPESCRRQRDRVWMLHSTRLQKKSNKGMSRGARTRGGRWEGSRAWGRAYLTGNEEKQRRTDGAPAKKFNSLGARFEGEREGKYRGGQGLLIGREKARINGLNWPESKGEDSAENGVDKVGMRLETMTS